MLNRKKKELKEQERDYSLIAKKDWHIVHNEYDIKIKEGEELPSNLPSIFLENLKTEKVI